MKHLYTLLRILSGIAIFAYLFWNFGLNMIISTLGGTPLSVVLFIIALIIASTLLGALNYHVLIGAFVQPPGFWHLLTCYVRSFVASLLLPSKIGEFSLIVLLRNTRLTLGQRTAIVLLDKMITGVVIGTLSILGAILLLDDHERNIVVLTLILLAAAGGSLFFLPQGRSFLRTIFPRFFTTRFQGFGESLMLILRIPWRIAADLLLTFTRHLLMSLSLFIGLHTFGASVPFFTVAIILAISFIVSLIPLTPGGFGLREGTAVLLFAREGIAGEITLAANFLVIILLYVVCLVGLLSVRCTKVDVEDKVRGEVNGKRGLF